MLNQLSRFALVGAALMLALMAPRAAQAGETMRVQVCGMLGCRYASVPVPPHSYAAPRTQVVIGMGMPGYYSPPPPLNVLVNGALFGSGSPYRGIEPYYQFVMPRNIHGTYRRW